MQIYAKQGRPVFARAQVEKRLKASGIKDPAPLIGAPAMTLCGEQLYHMPETPARPVNGACEFTAMEPRQ
ncbi:MAG: hypothetical protein SFU86_07545 [Pirellulaceae bacterium]|nr:hypothetical protein [Pirellulaceae bacterium]